MRTLGDVRRTPITMRLPGTADMSAAVGGLRTTKPATNRQRRVDKCRDSLKEFCRTYLSHHFPSDFCELHDDIFAACDTPSPKKGKRVARIAPRKFGKSTIISLAKPLQDLAYKRRHFILMIGESATASEANLATITQELENNELLLEDFPHLAPAKDAKGQLVKWTDNQITIASMDTIMARGMGARMRGIKYRQMRPDLAILDDPESPETADTFLKRRRHKRWFGGTFMGLGAESWDIYVIGNLPDHDCLIASLVLDKNWDGKLYRAINLPKRDDERYPLGNTRFDGTPLWPEVWGHEQLERYKREPNVGVLGYVREMLNDPRVEEDKIFNPQEFVYIDFNPATDLGNYRDLILAVDPAGGEKPGEMKRGVRDWCAIGLLGRHKNGCIDVLDVMLTRLTPEKQISALLDLYDKWRARRIRAEENMWKNLYGPSIMEAGKKRQLYPTIEVFMSHTNKLARIQGIQPLIHPMPGAGAIVRFNRALIDKVPEYFGQFDEFPTGHDDGPDMTEIGVRGLERGALLSAPSGIVNSGSYWRRGA